MVVMMNPGSSYPLNGIDNNFLPSEAQPDITQKQIMRVMDAVGFDYARILNLSDLRTPDSGELYRFLKSDESSLVDCKYPLKTAHSLLEIFRHTDYVI